MEFEDYENEELLEVYEEVKELLEKRGLLVKMEPKSVEDLQREEALQKNANWYFIICGDDDYPMTYLVRKDHWDEYGYIDDCVEDPDFVLPPGYYECQEMAYEYSGIDKLDFITSKIWELTEEEIDKVLELHRKDFTEFGFTEAFWNDHPKNK